MIPLKNGNVEVKMETNYPWDGNIKLNIDPVKRLKFKLYLRVPGWHRGKTVPGDLYTFTGIGNIAAPYGLTVNGKPADGSEENGYYVIDRTWQKGDKVEYTLSMGVNLVHSRDSLKQNNNRIAIQRGPIVYCLEGADNNGNAWNIIIPENTKFETIDYKVLNENVKALTAEVPVVIVNDDGTSLRTETRKIIATPYYTWANRGKNEMQVWLPTKIKDVKINY
jgi:DUF1680 family protein